MLHLSSLSAALVLALVAVSTSHAQQIRGVQSAPSTAPSASTQAAQAAPNPTGLRSLFPAGLNSGSGASQSGDPIARGNAPVTTPGTTGTSSTTTNGGVTTTTTTINGVTTETTATTGTTGITPELLNANPAFFGAAAATTTMGAGGAAGPSQFVPGGSAGFSAVEIARAFISADGNRDGELSRSEARRLTLTTMTFEEMDRNFDGVISRGEYEDGLR